MGRAGSTGGSALICCLLRKPITELELIVFHTWPLAWRGLLPLPHISAHDLSTLQSFLLLGVVRILMTDLAFLQGNTLKRQPQILKKIMHFNPLQICGLGLQLPLIDYWVVSCS